MPLKFTLETTITDAGITKNQLSVASGIRHNTITALCKGDAKQLNVETLDALILALNRLSNKQYGLDAVVVYSEPMDAN